MKCKFFIEYHAVTGLYYYGARYYDSRTSVWLSTDPLQERFPNISSYAYCIQNPVKYIDPNGEAWKPTTTKEHDGNLKYNGFEWIAENQSYDLKGNLKEGLYHQAIFFSDNGTFNDSQEFNMGSSTATIYKADGTKETFEASTYPARLASYPTVPEGLYEAKVGMHNGSSSSYTALRMSDVGTVNFNNSKIELGIANPAHNDNRTFASGINIHKAGSQNKTGLTNAGSPISAGCSLIKISDWKSFIGIFNTSEQKNNVIGIIMSRSLSTPVNVNREPAFNFFKNGARSEFFDSKNKFNRRYDTY